MNNTPLFMRVAEPNYIGGRTRTDSSVASVQINEVALDIILDKPAGEIDPYMNQPFKTVQIDDATVIYSLGPDRQDQGGAVTYDATNGTMSAGDIFIRVPKRR